jgi:hypothetical protein
LQQTYSQNYKFKTSGVSVLENERGKWGKWSDLQLVNVVVIIDNKSRIVIYSKLFSCLKSVEYQPTEENDTDVVHLTCKDNNGDDCTLP